MALFRDEQCYTCKKVTEHINGSCHECRCREANEKEAAFQALTLEEKIQDLHERLKEGRR